MVATLEELFKFALNEMEAELNTKDDIQMESDKFSLIECRNIINNLSFLRPIGYEFNIGKTKQKLLSTKYQECDYFYVIISNKDEVINIYPTLSQNGKNEEFFVQDGNICCFNKHNYESLMKFISGKYIKTKRIQYGK